MKTSFKVIFKARNLNSLAAQFFKLIRRNYFCRYFSSLEFLRIYAGDSEAEVSWV